MPASQSGISWEYYRSLLAVLNEGSLSAAARALNTTQPTIGRHISALEQQLKVTLFIRNQNGLKATAAALALKSQAQAMASMAASMERTAAGSHSEAVKGTVRISASEIIGAEVLPPVLKALHTENPGLTVELVLSDRIQNLLEKEADIAVRMLRPEQNQLIVTHAGDVEAGLYATAGYLQHYGTPEDTHSLRQHTLIGFDQPLAFIRNAIATMPDIVMTDRDYFSFRADSDLARLALLRAGAGIGFCQRQLARKKGMELEPVLEQQIRFRMPVWITMHESLRHDPCAAAAFQSLKQGLQAYTESYPLAD